MFQSDLLQDKCILITGGGTGLGKAMGRRVLELGARLVICGRRQGVLEETREEFDEAFPNRTRAIPCDLRDPAQVEAMVNRIWDEGSLDALVNNAAGNFLARTESLSPRALDAVLAIVMHGTAYVTLACGKRWLAEGHPGNVLSIVATYAETGSPFVVPSAMAKAGVLAMTRSLAVEWGGRGIRLNAIAPGPFPTEGAWARLVPNEAMNRAWMNKIPLGRVGEHRELADLAAFLLAEGSAYINGEVVTIDGGEWLKGAGQFSLMENLRPEDWAAMKAR
ncbi:SDR family oxidoreductase [Pelagibius marinus]|uniref:SDR family oxidoreductase n=1 Tax=Pelagibius marinus TaxID=2762760 RepID=UPI0018721715|nr:SDR family oxidoreductase [Pelagibius marinus]